MPIDKLFGMIWDIVEGIHRWITLGEWAINGLLDLFLHFVWSSVAGVLAFSLTYWTIRGLFFIGASLLRLPTSPPTQVVRGIIGFGWAVALFASLWAHLWWDRLPIFG